MVILDAIACLGFITCLMALPFSFYFFHRHPIRSFLHVTVPLCIASAACDTSQRIIQAKALDALDALSDQYQLSVDGAIASNPKEVLTALKTLDWRLPHHSSPGKRINVEIFDRSRRTFFSLARDSGNPREYWVFFPEHFITRSNEIGRIKTSVFDSY